MSRDDLYSFFIELLKTVSGADIARATGYSSGAISAVKNGKYQGDDTIVLQAVFAIYGNWHCPALNRTIGLAECQTERVRPYSAGRIRQWAACQNCDRNDNNGGGK